MLKEADLGILFKPSQKVREEFPQFPVATDYEILLDTIHTFAKSR
jgi:phosphoserine/homoserine phosphotransferase